MAILLALGDVGVVQSIIRSACSNRPTLLAWRTTCKEQETVVASFFMDHLASKRTKMFFLLESLARRHRAAVTALCTVALQPPARRRHLAYLEILEDIHLGDARLSVCQALTELIEGSMANTKRSSEVLHRCFQVLAKAGSKSDPGLLDLFLLHIDFVHREDTGGFRWEERAHRAARDGLIKVAGRGDSNLVAELRSRIGTDKQDSSRARVDMIVALGRVAKVGDATVISFLLELLPQWREYHSKKVASAARSALLDVVHAPDRDAMRRCLQDWDEPNLHEFALAAIRDSVKDGGVRGIVYSEDPQYFGSERDDFAVSIGHVRAGH